MKGFQGLRFLEGNDVPRSPLASTAWKCSSNQSAKSKLRFQFNLFLELVVRLPKWPKWTAAAEKFEVIESTLADRRAFASGAVCSGGVVGAILLNRTLQNMSSCQCKRA